MIWAERMHLCGLQRAGVHLGSPGNGAGCWGWALAEGGEALDTGGLAAHAAPRHRALLGGAPHAPAAVVGAVRGGGGAGGGGADGQGGQEQAGELHPEPGRRGGLGSAGSFYPPVLPPKAGGIHRRPQPCRAAQQIERLTAMPDLCQQQWRQGRHLKRQEPGRERSCGACGSPAVAARGWDGSEEMPGSGERQTAAAWRAGRRD